MTIGREEELYGMSKGQWVQCQFCGSLHKVEMQFDIEDDLFVKIRCEHCRDDTDHIWIGDRPEDVYLNGNLNVDPRYYQYKTK